MPRIFNIPGLLVLIIAIVGCAGGPRARTAGLLEEAYAGPVDEKVLIERVFFNRIGSLQSEVEVTVLDQGKKKIKLAGAFLYKSPGFMRLRVFDPFGDTVLDLYKRGSLLQVDAPLEGRLYEGHTPPIGLPSDALFSMEEDEDSYTLSVFRARDAAPPATPAVIDLISRFYFDRRTVRNTSMDHIIEGRRFMRMTFSRLAGQTPGEISISFFNGFTLEVELKEPVLNANLPDAAYSEIQLGNKELKSVWSLLTNPPRW